MRILRSSEVTPEMTAWAVSLLNGPLKLGDTAGPMYFGTVNVLAKIEIHTNGTPQNPAPHPHRGVTLYHADSGPPVAPEKWGYIEGVDVSGWQKGLDWKTIRDAGYTFAFIKATEGLTGISEQLATQHQGAGEAGMLRGLYHYLRARDDGAEQAGHLLSAASLHPCELPLVIDVEELDGQSKAKVATCVTGAVQALNDAGRKPIIYTMPAFWNTLPLMDLNAYLWVAHWTKDPAPELVNDWDMWTFWQYTATGSVPGYPGHADINRFVGTLDDLKAL